MKSWVIYNSKPWACYTYEGASVVNAQCSTPVKAPGTVNSQSTIKPTEVMIH